jgi:hypothetical protein
MQPEYPEDSPLSPIFGAITTVTKIVSTPATAMHWVSNKIGDFFKGITSSISDNMANMKSFKESLDSYSDEGKIKEINKLEFKSAGGVLGGVFTFASNFCNYGSKNHQ